MKQVKAYIERSNEPVFLTAEAAQNSCIPAWCRISFDKIVSRQKMKQKFGY